VIPVKDVKEDYDIEDTTAKNNILGSEADAVMLVLFAECCKEEEFWNLHELMDHTYFVAMILEDDEKKQIMKVHLVENSHHSPGKLTKALELATHQAEAGRSR
jgi:hypothetical protein